MLHKRTCKDSQCQQGNRAWDFYELWRQRHRQMEGAARELSSGGYLSHPATGTSLRCHSHRSSISLLAAAGANSLRQGLTRAGDAGWKEEQRRAGGDGARSPARWPRCLPSCREAAKPSSRDAAGLRSLGSAHVGSGAACESQLCTTRCPLPSPSHWLQDHFYCYYFSFLLSLFFSLFFDSLLAKKPSALQRAQGRADGGACQLQPWSQ